MYILFTEKDYMGDGERKYIGKSNTLRGAKQIRTRYWNKNGYIQIECADMECVIDDISYPYVMLMNLSKNCHREFMLPKSAIPTN